MAKYINNKGKQRAINLCKYKIFWDVEKIDEKDIEEAKEEQWIAVTPSCILDDIFEDVNSLYPDDYCSITKYVKIYYEYADDDILNLWPMAMCMSYPASEPSEDDDIPAEEFEREVSLSKKEIIYFSRLLKRTIGDKHSPEMQEVMIRYYESVDKTIYNFVNQVVHDVDVLPVTVGLLSESQCGVIKKSLGEKAFKFAPRIVMDADAVRHILSRHGINGAADHSLGNIEDIARMAFVIANFDDVIFDNVYSKKFQCADNSPAPHIVLKKRINGTYYVVEAVSDGKKGLSHIVSAYINNA